MPSSVQIFVAVLVLYVAVVNLLVVRSIRLTTDMETIPTVTRIATDTNTPVARAAPVALKTVAPLPSPMTTPQKRCYDGVVYVAVVVPPTAAARDNARHAVLAAVRRAVTSAPKGMRLHLILVGVRSSGLHTH